MKNTLFALVVASMTNTAVAADMSLGIHLGGGRYRHSSGQDHGRNGIGVDSLFSSDRHPVARHYRAELRGAGRVVRCHDGRHLA
mgnify:CR=1 FL=1